MPFIFGKIKYTYNNKPYNINSIGCDCKIIYEKLTNKYSLLIPEKINKEIIEHNKHFISIDPGIRTFITGISENEIIKINESKIIKYIKRKDKCINNELRSKNNKRKISVMCNRKLINITTEMHWKTINFLTNNYKNILFGNLSIKDISNNNVSNISKISKRIGYAYSFYKFKEKLKYKCQIKECNYIEVKENYTSKMCSNCGNYKENLGANKIYNCEKCLKIMDRDINASRNIYLKTLI